MELTLFLKRETLAKIRITKKITKKQKKLLTHCFCVSNLTHMSGQHSSDKKCVSVWIPRTLAARVQQAAKEHKMTLTDYVIWIYEKETEAVTLTPDAYRKIADDTERALRRAAAKGDARKAFDDRRKSEDVG